LRQLHLQIAHDHVYREEFRDGVYLRILFELAEVGKRHAGTQHRKTIVVHLALLHEFRVALEVRLGEEFAARHLDAELALEPEQDIEEVNRFGPQIALEGRGWVGFAPPPR